MSQTRISEEVIVHNLVTEIYCDIDKCYGPDSSNPLAYHNVEHAKDVVNAITAIGSLAVSRGKISPHELNLGIIAGAGHDYVKNGVRLVDEANSAEAVVTKMGKYENFTSDDMHNVWQLILATAVYFEDGALKQMTSQDNYLAQAVADGDLASLGRDTVTFWDRTTKLYEEDMMTVEESEAQRRFLDGTINLLQNHEFFTAEARLFFPNQAANLVFTEAVRELIAV